MKSLQEHFRVATIRSQLDKALIADKIDELIQLMENLDSADETCILAKPPVYLTSKSCHDSLFKLDVVSRELDRIRDM